MDPRHFAPLAGLAVLAGCGGEVSPEIAEQGGEPLDCAVNGASEYASSCRILEVSNADGTYFIVRHPDGGFRRLELAETVTGFVAGDGADESSSVRDGDYVVLTIGVDRYRWKEPAQ